MISLVILCIKWTVNSPCYSYGTQGHFQHFRKAWGLWPYFKVTFQRFSTCWETLFDLIFFPNKNVIVFIFQCRHCLLQVQEQVKIKVLELKVSGLTLAWTCNFFAFTNTFWSDFIYMPRFVWMLKSSSFLPFFVNTWVLQFLVWKSQDGIDCVPKCVSCI